VSTFGVGLNAWRSEFRSSDYAGRPVDPVTEGDTARSERIRMLQDRWTERQLPSAEPIDVIGEWMARNPANRMSAFAMRLAENPEMLPQAESEPAEGQAPRPGGLLARMVAERRERTALAHARLPGGVR